MTERMTTKRIAQNISQCSGPRDFSTQGQNPIHERATYWAMCKPRGSFEHWKDCKCLGGDSFSEKAIDRRVDHAYAAQEETT